MEIGDAPRLLRVRHGLSQKDVSKREGAPNFASLSHWENGRKFPSLKLLMGYLRSLGLDFCDLQDALNEVSGPTSTGCRAELERLKERIRELELHLGLVEEAPREDGQVWPVG